MNQNHFKLTDVEFKNQFENCELDPTIFSHEAHLRLAWIYINQLGNIQAEEEIQNHLKKYVSFVGATDKYNKTLTIAAIKAVSHFMLKSASTNVKDFLVEFPQLKNNFKELMTLHYSFDIYNLEIAKIEYLEPDLIPFD